MSRRIAINRAPVLALWATAVAALLGHDENAALSLGKAVAGLTAQRKGQALGIYHRRERPGAEPETEAAGWLELVGRQVPVRATAEGLRAVIRGEPQDPAAARRYLESRFGPDLDAVRSAFDRLARSIPRSALPGAANGLYERFRPEVPVGTRGWGAKGVLDLDLVESLAGEE
ncbi:MAG: hypothetical protein R6X12_06005 [bacterium]